MTQDETVARFAEVDALPAGSLRRSLVAEGLWSPIDDRDPAVDVGAAWLVWDRICGMTRGQHWYVRYAGTGLVDVSYAKGYYGSIDTEEKPFAEGVCRTAIKAVLDLRENCQARVAG